MDMSLSKLQELVKDREAWRAAVQGVTKSQTHMTEQLNWTELKDFIRVKSYTICPLVTCFPFLVAQTIKNPPALQETWVWSLDRKDPLEKDMAIHSSVVAWRIPWTEDPGGLSSTGLQRVRHDWSGLAHAHAQGCGEVKYIRLSFVSHSESYIEVLIPNTSECDLVGKHNCGRGN